MFKPMTYKIFKGMKGKWGALNLAFSDAHYFRGKEKDFTGNQALQEGKLQEGWDQREGCLFLDICSSKGENVYDWENKTIMALSVNDMGKLLLGLATGDECNIMHDPGAKSEKAGQIKKYLKFTSPQGLKVGGLITVNQTQGEQTRSHTVPITGDEVMVLRSLIQAAIARALAW